MRLLLIVVMFNVQCSMFNVYAQITIGGNVYGGGNAGDTGGKTKVTIYNGTLSGGVFGGARQADVKGSSFVHIDGQHMSGNIIIKDVYGGNDISGTVGTSADVPEELKVKENSTDAKYPYEEYGVNATYNAFVRTTPERTVKDDENKDVPAYKIFIGSLYGGGNGDYKYIERTVGGKKVYVAQEKQQDGSYVDVVTSATAFEKPVQDKVYLELLGGTIAYAYAGGNNATVEKNADIYINNKSVVTTDIQGPDPDDATETINLLTSEKWLASMGIATLGNSATSDEYQFSRVFGGNNKTDMRIQPTWHLKGGFIRNLYSGGNEGDMTSETGLLLEIMEGSDIHVYNVYGGCRKADVHPQIWNKVTKKYTGDAYVENLSGYAFRDQLSARVLVRGGHIHNVYGGNDVSGRVYGGNAVGVYTSITGSIYGGGNGSYPYTDNPKLANTLNYGDYYYNPVEILDLKTADLQTDDGNGGKTYSSLQSLRALNEVRPDAEQVSIRVKGTDADHPTIIGGAIYVGGNSATLRQDTEKLALKTAGDERYKDYPYVELKVGSYVIADEVFLGNNGTEMVRNESNTDALRLYKTKTSDNSPFVSFDLTDKAQFAEYMEGAAMDLIPSVIFDPKVKPTDVEYVPYSTKFGSFYCGGNRGSMTYPGTNVQDFNVSIYIYDKVVGGCNDAYIPEQFYNNTKLNAAYEGGIKVPLTDAEKAVNPNKLVLNFNGLQLLPKRWKYDSDGNKEELVWNTVNSNPDSAEEDGYVPTGPFTKYDLTRRFEGGNIYGGCYNSGYVNGNVVINVNNTLVNRNILFDKVEEDSKGEAVLYGDNVLTGIESYNIQERRTGVILGQQGMDVLGKALNIFGGGKGKATEIWGSTTINLNKGYMFQVFGGSQEGVIGKPVDAADLADEDRDTSNDYTFGDGVTSGNGRTYCYSTDYNCYLNLKGIKKGVTKQEDTTEDMAECEFIYGGGFEGPVCGNTIINLGKGRVFNTFAGACNANVLGHTETYIGRQILTDAYSMNMGEYYDNDDYFIADNADPNILPFPYIRDYVYGGNDLGGEIMDLGDHDFSNRVRSDVKGMTYQYNASSNPKPEQQSAAAYIEYRQGRAEGIFGGCYGTYDYTEEKFKDYTYYEGETGIPSGKKAGDPRVGTGFIKPRMDNAFVNFRPLLTNVLKNDEYNIVKLIYGSGQGYPGDSDRDIMQNRSYILIDIPQEMTNYKDMQVFGAGAWSGLGMRMEAADAKKPENLDKVSAIIDLTRGEINSVYGASYEEGFTRRTVVNVPDGSTIKLAKIFGGGYGLQHNQVCDAYESHVNYASEYATVSNNIYGGNNNSRQTLYTQVNVKKPVYTGVTDDKGNRYMATIYGAGYGYDTWAGYTEVNLLGGAQVYEVYGGGEMGRVVNLSTSKAMAKTLGGEVAKLPGDYGDEEGLNGHLAIKRPDGKKHNTNVLIHKDAIVHNYAYGGGKGYEKDDNHPDAEYENGDVYGTTYIALMGGTVKKDIFAAGTIGAVLDKFGKYNDGEQDVDITDDDGNKLVAGTTAYVAGGSVRNVYGGGWKGAVGKHRKLVYKTDENGERVKDDNDEYVMVEADADIHESAENDISGETHVIIGIRQDQTEENLENAIKAVLGDDTNQTALNYYCGVPTVQRNAYGGGEGGAVYGKTNLTLNNGYIGYEYNATTGKFEEKINDETYYENEKYAGDGRLRDCGNVFGGGYDARSSVDESNVEMYGGTVRGSMHGGGEIATIGRGSTTEGGAANSERVFEAIYKKGKTHVEMYNGHVKRNVFGGGKGYNLLGYGSNSDLYTDGYTFGQTEVYIHGGKIGTEDGLADGYGNVFGGGDLGYIYSYGYDSDKTKADKLAGKTTSSPGHYYYYDSGGNLTEDCKVVVSPYLQVKDVLVDKKDGEGQPVMDGDNVVQEPYVVSFGGKTYRAYDYVPTDYLNTLSKNKNDAGWQNLITKDASGERGVQIYNAVFAGGNVASNSDTHYANATTVFGNTTATIYDVYHRDFVTIGTEHIGGLYGGGNLSMVDGYRELNITNYGTDYYNLQTKITIDEYHNDLSDRERAYFQLQYECQETYTGQKQHKQGDKISEEDFNNLPEGEEVHWTMYGFCSIYAGRLLNTIQRADLCGVYGSRMVLQGAQDRVASVGENIVYTINRVGELSLNTQHSQAGDTEADDEQHGNYFGIYSLVNYLGNLTSDVRMKDDYVDKNGDNVIIENTSYNHSYYSYKEDRNKKNSNWPNLGKSRNEVALASGVFLELTTENSTAEQKDYGYITGVVELDLINVKREELEGGGFVYAKNEHRLPLFYADKENVILSEYNAAKQGWREACKTYKRYRYSDTYDDGPHKGDSNDADWENAGEGWVISIGGVEQEAYAVVPIQTSGNFIHPKKHIVDDCYPTNNAYIHGTDNYSPAHYWYIKGTVYVYDQVVSAYAGSASPYSKEVPLPLTITAASHGKLKLLNVKPNRYAYWYKNSNTEQVKIGEGENEEDKIVWVNHLADGYRLNDVITWWDWQNLPEEEQALFVEETYVNAEACTIGTKKYDVGEYVMLPENYNTLLTTTPDNIKDYNGEDFEDDEGNALTGADLVKYVFRKSNNVGHDTGYVLTFDMNTPKVWNAYYTNVNNHNHVITKTEYDALLEAAKASSDPESAVQTVMNTYIEGPTFSQNESNTLVLGKRDYTKDDIVTKAVYDAYSETSDYDETKMQRAYVAKEEVSYTYNTVSKTVNPGSAISYTEWNSLADKKSAFAKALVCTKTLKLAENVYLTYGDLIAEDDVDDLKATQGLLVTSDEIESALTDAYICTETGKYGGRNYYRGTYYSAIESWCNLSETDRGHFNFDYDALNLLIDRTYSVDPTATSGSHTTEAIYHKPYSDEVSVEYKAMFNGYKGENDEEITTYTYTYTYIDEDSQEQTETKTINKNDKIDNIVFEKAVPNYKRYYSKVNYDQDVNSDTGHFYIANDNFIYGGEPYAKGQVVSMSVYEESEDENSDIAGKVDDVDPGDWTGIFYYCNENHAEGSTTVNKSTIIDEDAYKDLRDDQKYFTIQGMEPTERTTFYVSRESEVKDVTKEKIITVVYQYTYYETDDDGESDSNDASLMLTNELHVINIHLQLESGAPSIGPLDEAPLVFPGEAVGLTLPKVTPGTYEVLTNGWTLFKNKNDADHLRNGVPFNNNSDPLYWYMNQDHYVAFYSETYLGKTYSNYVKLNVANYHDLADIMENHKDNHLYIDRSDVDRPCKIYINDYAGLKDDDPRKGKNGLDELESLFELSLLTPTEDELDNNGLIKSGTFQGHAPLGSYIQGTENLEFILRTDIDGAVPDGSPARTSIAARTTDPCFGGNIHGDGHTISGLTQSLIGKLCGSIYNLGVTGSFTTAGVADEGEGFVENCWVMSSATALPDGQSKAEAVFGNPTASGCTQIVNCYFPESNKALYTDHTTSSRAGGNARMMEDKSFYNGEVAYNLNGYYLGKRYYDNNTSWKSEDANKPISEYRYLKAEDLTPAEDGTASNNLSKAYYPNVYAYYQTTGTTLTPLLGYVESRYFDGDFRYASGSKPESFNPRRRNVKEEITDPVTHEVTEIEAVVFPPIWPDDYLFFGQVLNYGYLRSATSPSHQEQPSVINLGANNNRVYRAPAYIRSSEMRAAYFNSDAVFADTKKGDATKLAYKGMTAIDFTGGNGDVTGVKNTDYQPGLIPATSTTPAKFFPPLLDNEDGLSGFRVEGLTKNLLAYTTSGTSTDGVVGDVLYDYAYQETDDTYRTVGEWDTHNLSSMKGHRVQLLGGNYIAINDHLLIDREDFNAPISYTFDDGTNSLDGKAKRMWYQRMPDNYVNLTKGWESVSLPFTAELVTTNDKGELTHFYSGNNTDGSSNNIGHEYWLRECTGITKTTGNDIATANFTYPTAIVTATEDDDRTVTNTFLWDYYYEGNHIHKDANGDTYQDADKSQKYYSVEREYKDYPLLTAGKPYLVGFPGKTYFEFDLSGEWSAASTGDTRPDPISRQTITFASAEGATIAVSDTELEYNAFGDNGYFFKPNYLNIDVPAGGYNMAADGGSYDKVTGSTTADAKKLYPFRTYFQANNAITRSIVFSNNGAQLGGGEQDESQDNVAESMEFYTKKNKVVVTSHMRSTADVGIFNVSGMCVASFNIEPGETVETLVYNSGVYIIRAAGGHYTKKVSVK